MTDWQSLMPLILAAFVLIPAAVHDVRSRRIPNALCVAGFLAGILVHGILGGIAGAGMSAGSGFMLLVGMFPFFALGWMGAGDVKLIAAAGAIAGSFQAAVLAAVAVVLTGALMSLLVILWHRQLKELVGRILISMYFLMANRRMTYIKINEKALTQELPYAVAIALGTLGALAADVVFTGGFNYA